MLDFFTDIQSSLHLSFEPHFLQTKYIFVIINSFAQEKGITDFPPENIQEQVYNPFFKKTKTNTKTKTKTNTRTTDRLMMLYVFGMAMTKGV